MERWPSVASANLWSWWKEKGGRNLFSFAVPVGCRIRLTRPDALGLCVDVPQQSEFSLCYFCAAIFDFSKLTPFLVDLAYHG